jgi:hypothetical protein
MSQSRAALAAIATTLIPLAMSATANTGRPTQQNGKDHENVAYTIVNQIPGARC